MPKFFVSPNDVQENFLVLTGENACKIFLSKICAQNARFCFRQKPDPESATHIIAQSGAKVYRNL